MRQLSKSKLRERTAQSQQFYIKESRKSFVQVSSNKRQSFMSQPTFDYSIDEVEAASSGNNLIALMKGDEEEDRY